MSTILLITLPATRVAYVLLALLIGGESAGIPLPGETALITASILASQGKLWLPLVIAVAATAAIVGDNIGYAAGRFGGRALLERWPPAARYADRVLPPAQVFFQRHGGKAVFLGRFVALMRITAAWLAGVGHMKWWRFFAFNAAGGILWATGIGLLAYFVGKAAADAVSHYGLVAGVVLAVLGVVAFAAHRWWRHRTAEEV